MIDENLKAGNVINLDLDTPIYKYIPFKYLKLMILNSSLFLEELVHGKMFMKIGF